MFVVSMENYIDGHVKATNTNSGEEKVKSVGISREKGMI